MSQVNFTYSPYFSFSFPLLKMNLEWVSSNLSSAVHYFPRQTSSSSNVASLTAVSLPLHQVVQEHKFVVLLQDLHHLSSHAPEDVRDCIRTVHTSVCVLHLLTAHAHTHIHPPPPHPPTSRPHTHRDCSAVIHSILRVKHRYPSPSILSPSPSMLELSPGTLQVGYVGGASCA